MKDDEPHDSGLGGLAWFQLGRASVRSQASLKRSLQTVFGSRTSAIDVNQVLAENQALATGIVEIETQRQALVVENARLRQELDGYRIDYERLNKWADEAERNLKLLREGQDA